MLCLPQKGFVLLSMPKCASTSLTEALAPHASIVFQHLPDLKHIGYQGFTRGVRPILVRSGYRRRSYEVVSLFREPVAWLDSWYRYRSRAGLRRRDDPSYSGEMSFEEYAEAYMAGERRGPMPRGRPSRFVSEGEEYVVGTDRLFALERPDVWGAWFEERMGAPLEVARRNRSNVRTEIDLPASTRRRLEEYLAPEYAVYDRLRSTGEWAGARGTVLGAPADDRAGSDDPDGS